MVQPKNVWFDRNAENVEQDMTNLIFLLLRHNYTCHIVDEGLGYVVFFGHVEEEMGEKLTWLDTEEEFVITQDEYNERYIEGCQDTLKKVFNELKTMAEDDLYTAMVNALEYKEQT